jgi:hypothetical protein
LKNSILLEDSNDSAILTEMFDDELVVETLPLREA